MFGSRRKYETQSLSPADSAASASIMETLECLQLDPRETILLGSAALTLYGVTLREYNSVSNPDSQRPSDLDFASTADYIEELYANGTTSGLHTEKKDPRTHSRKYGAILRIDTPALPADITTTYKEKWANREQHDRRLRQRIERDGVQIDGANMRVASPQALAEILADISAVPKSRQDLSVLRRRFPSL